MYGIGFSIPFRIKLDNKIVLLIQKYNNANPSHVCLDVISSWSRFHWVFVLESVNTTSRIMMFVFHTSGGLAGGWETGYFKVSVCKTVFLELYAWKYWLFLKLNSLIEREQNKSKKHDFIKIKHVKLKFTKRKFLKNTVHQNSQTFPKNLVLFQLKKRDQNNKIRYHFSPDPPPSPPKNTIY